YFKNKEDYYNFPKMNPAEPLGTMLFKEIKNCIKDDEIYLIPGIFTGLFDSTYMGFGIERFSKLLIKDQTFIKKVIRDKESFYFEFIKHAIDEFNLDAFFIGDDLAYNSRPFISPRHFIKLFLPSYKKIANMMHKRGVKLIFHTDGNIMPILSELLQFCDSIHPWQVSANIDIFKIKEKYGDKICIKGNVPISMLVHKSPYEISIYVKKLLKICAPGGGYMLSSGNSITPDIPWKNYLTMLSTFWKYRNYPINIP
ncbi:MAG: uroporphyrinogen decarboxylase family protein, partial [Promethearchaeota archaeon]